MVAPVHNLYVRNTTNRLKYKKKNKKTKNSTRRILRIRTDKKRRIRIDE